MELKPGIPYSTIVPQVIPQHIALRSRLKDSVTHAVSVCETLEMVIAVKPSSPGRFHGKVDHSQPPWYSPVANAIMDLHALARDMEGKVRLMQGLPLRERGGSDGNTRIALDAILRHAEATDDGHVQEMTREIENWSRRAKNALGITEPPVRLPRSEGENDPVCPFCGAHTLRMIPIRGMIFCIDKDCRDEEGRKPKAELVFSPNVGEILLTWQDGISGIPS
jgi:hypothetical protein